MKEPAFNNPSEATASAGIGCLAGLTLFFLVFFTIGAVAAFLVGRDAVRELQTYAWKKADCRCEGSNVTG